MELMNDKRGVMELLYNEIVKLIIVAIVGVSILYFIHSSANGEASILLLKSRENALWIDAAMNSPQNAETAIKFQKEFEDVDKKYKLGIDNENKFVISEEGLVSEKIGKRYRIVKSLNKNLEMQESDAYFEVNVK